MYTPSAFRQDDLAQLHAQIRQTPLAVLVSHGSTGLQASHLPLLLVAEEGSHGTLYGHFARANPHWQAFAGSAEALAIFSGADAYVSPGWYPSKAEQGKAVPTWNYISVQARGQLEVFDEPARRQAIGNWRSTCRLPVRRIARGSPHQPETLRNWRSGPAGFSLAWPPPSSYR